MKTETRDYLGSRRTGRKRELCLIEGERQHVEADPSLDAERRAIHIKYYDVIIRYLPEGIDHVEAALRGVSPGRNYTPTRLLRITHPPPSCVFRAKCVTS